MVDMGGCTIALVHGTLSAHEPFSGYVGEGGENSGADVKGRLAFAYKAIVESRLLYIDVSSTLGDISTGSLSHNLLDAKY